MNDLWLVQVTRNDVDSRTGELLQLIRRVRVTDNDEDSRVGCALLQTPTNGVFIISTRPWTRGVQDSNKGKARVGSGDDIRSHDFS